MRVDADDLARPCSYGKETHIGVKEIVIEAGAIERLGEEMSDGILKEYISPLVICDTNIYEATEEIMEDIYDRCQVLVLDAEGLRADRQAVTIVENIMEDDIDLILAVGAGTIHNISRFVAHKYKVPFISVPTAASTDRFVSTVAVMDWDGEQKTIPVDVPMCVYADTDIFANAPKHLNASGVSDLLEKYNCSEDGQHRWLLSGEKGCREMTESEARALKAVRACRHSIEEGEEEACEKLMYALVLSGLVIHIEGESLCV